MWFWLILAVIALVIVVVAARALMSQRASAPSRHTSTSQAGGASAPSEATEVALDPTARGADGELYPGLPDNYQLTSGPRVTSDDGEKVLLREWLRHEAGGNAWSDVVADFYGRAAADPAVASYFAGVDMATLQRHFMAALMLVSGDGVTVGTVRAMERAHTPVVNEQGEPIDEEIWGKVIGALVVTLQDRRVPDAAIGELAETIAPLKPVIVRTPAHA